MDLLAILSAGGDSAMIAVAIYLSSHHKRIRRIEGHIWPDTFKD